MASRMLLRTAVAVGLLTGAWAARPAPAAAGTTGQPNIVVIMADDQDDMDSLSHMPRLQALAARGVVFSNSFVNFSLCCPSRASFLTGQASHNTHIQGNQAPDGGYAMFKPTEDNSLGVWLQAAGYRTGIMGKLMNGYDQSADRFHVMPGWNEWDMLASAHGGYRYFGYTLNENGTMVKYGRQAYDYQTDVIAAKGDAFIRQSTGQPFFLLLEPIAPHGTHSDEEEDGARGFPEAAPRYQDAFDTLKFNKPRNFDERDISDKPQAFTRWLDGYKDLGAMTQSFRARREAMLATDDLVQRVVDALTETGQIDNTYIIVTSDNGYSEGSHRWQGKTVLYEEAIRVPLVLAGPGVPQGRTLDQLVNNLDVVASIVKWTGATAGRTLDGRDLSPILADPHAPWRTALLVENKHQSGVRTKDWFYAESQTAEFGLERELYRFADDPAEMTNVADSDSHAARKAQAELTPVLQTLKTCAGDSCWVGADSAPASDAAAAGQAGR